MHFEQVILAEEVTLARPHHRRQRVHRAVPCQASGRDAGVRGVRHLPLPATGDGRQLVAPAGSAGYRHAGESVLRNSVPRCRRYIWRPSPTWVRRSETLDESDRHQRGRLRCGYRPALPAAYERPAGVRMSTEYVFDGHERAVSTRTTSRTRPLTMAAPSAKRSWRSPGSATRAASSAPASVYGWPLQVHRNFVPMLVERLRARQDLPRCKPQ